MLDKKTIQKIEEYISEKPRSIQELATYLKKNWRTVDRYVTQIKEDLATIETRTFREGTRGALKIVYSASFEKASINKFQEKLEQEIFKSKRKEEFSSFDIFQHVDKKNKKAIIEKEVSENSTNLQELQELLLNTKKELKLFSGNLSWANLKKGKINIYETLDNLVKKGIKIKVICRVDIAGIENIKKMLSLNHKNATNQIEIRHQKQPLRAIIFDDKIVRLKEIEEPTGKIKELDKKIFIFYTIKDQDWTNWISKIFNKMWNESIGAEKRLEEIKEMFEK